MCTTNKMCLCRERKCILYPFTFPIQAFLSVIMIKEIPGGAGTIHHCCSDLVLKAFCSCGFWVLTRKFRRGSMSHPFLWEPSFALQTPPEFWGVSFGSCALPEPWKRIVKHFRICSTWDSWGFLDETGIFTSSVEKWCQAELRVWGLCYKYHK